MIPEPAADEIHIEQLEIEATVGVPEAERSQPQRLLVSLTLTPRDGFRDLADEISHTIDYAVVCDETKRFAASRQTKLIETLANELATHLLAMFPIARIRVEVRKFVLPETRYVAVSIVR